MKLTEFLLARIADWEAFWQTASSDEQNGRRLVEVMLAECEAKRRIIELHSPNEHGTVVCSTSNDWVEPSPDDEPTLRYLALPYADHPDYRQEWADA